MKRPGSAPRPADQSAIADAIGVIRGGGLVAFPTETVYGLGADAANPRAVAGIFAAKGRPANHPLIVHLAEPEAMGEWAEEVPDEAAALARAFWPGPLTVVLRRAGWVPDTVTGGLDTVGLRVPSAPVARRLLDSFAEAGGRGLAAPSANRFGRVSPTTAADVAADLGDAVDLILDGGACPVGLESTIVDCSSGPARVLRPGGVPAEALADVLGFRPEVGGRPGGAVRSPGMLASHYAPDARVEVVAAGEVQARAAALLAEGRRVGVLAPSLPPGLPPEVVALAPAGTPEAYARCLYARLRSADRHRLDVLLAVPPPEAGIGAAVVDRLRRAGSRR